MTAPLSPWEYLPFREPEQLLLELVITLDLLGQYIEHAVFGVNRDQVRVRHEHAAYLFSGGVEHGHTLVVLV